MAQTITAVRGNTAYTPNATNTLTLYTNGSTGSSRVIINSLGFVRSDSAIAVWRSYVSLNNSAGGSAVVAAASGNSVTNVYFMPGTTSIPSANATSGASTFFCSNGDNTNDPGNMNTTMLANQNSYYHFCPKSIWMGPSDSLVLRAFNGGSGTSGNVVWNFTVITES